MVSKESDACFGTTIPHDGFPGVKFRVRLGNWLAVHTVVPEGTGPGDVIYFELSGDVYQLLKNPPDDEFRILHLLVLPGFLDSEAEHNSQLSVKDCIKDSLLQ